LCLGSIDRHRLEIALAEAAVEDGTREKWHSDRFEISNSYAKPVNGAQI